MIKAKAKMIYIGLALSVLIMAGVMYLSYDRYNRTIDDYNLVNHTGEILREIYNGQAQMYETESSVRAYLILKKLQHIPQVGSDQEKMNKILDNIAYLSRDNKNYKVPLKELRTLVDEQFMLWSHISRNIYALDRAQEDSLVVRGIQLNNDMTNVWRNLKREEYSLLEKRSTNKDAGIQSSPRFLMISSLVSLIIIGVMFIILQKELDTTEALSAEMEKKNVELSRSNKELEQFAYVASHDLQEPLRKLRSFGERLLVKEQSNLSTEGKEMIGKLNGFAQKMQRLIDDLLMFSRVVNTKFETKEVDLNKSLNDAKANLSDVIIDSKALISNDVLPKVNGFESQLTQLFQNLISNSIKYSRREVTPQITITSTIVDGRGINDIRKTDKDKSFYKIVVADNGIGFDNQYAEKIFVVFQRLHGKSEYEGTGIGLAISKAVINNHNGYISAEGIEGTGATFTIYLPVTLNT